MIARHQAWPDALARQSDDNSPAKRPGLVDRELSRQGFGREVGKLRSGETVRNFLETDEKDGTALPNDDLVAFEMHPETPPRLMWNGHN